MAETVFEREARAVRQFQSDLGSYLRDGESTLAERASAALQAYATRLEDAGVSSHAVTPARYALAVLIDHAARSERRVRTSAWLAAAHVHLFDRREITTDTLRRFRETAETEGGDFTELAQFLGDVIDELEGKRKQRGTVSRKPAVLLSLASLGLVACLALYAAFLDFRYHTEIMSSFEDEVQNLLTSSTAERLSQLSQLNAQVLRASGAAPLAQLVTIPFWESGPKATDVYRAEVRSLLPEAIRVAIGEALATEGEDLEQYDTLRAWAILSGGTNWAPAYVSDWLAQRNATLGTGALASHVRALDGPVFGVVEPDEELMEQARRFAVNAPEEERAFLELTRLEDLQTLPNWKAGQAVPGIEDVLVLRTGAALSQGNPAIFTEAGWAYARDIGIGVAVQIARAEAGRMFADPVATRNDTPDLVLKALQEETLRHWKGWLSDLRVRPFSDRDSALRISGALAQRNNPLDRLLQEVWTQIGGRDRRRPHDLQLMIAAEFGPAIQYVEQGKIQELRALFAALNVAVGAIEFNNQQGAEKLMNVQELARTVSALQSAPAIVAQISEDVLAQTSAAHSSLLTNPLTREWQKRVYPLCQSVVDGQFPFQDGDDAGSLAFAELFGPQGALRQFVTQYAGRFIDQSSEVWRWKPEARLSGVGQDSAQFLQQALTVSSAFFDGSGALGQTFEIAALAERGEATLVIGGQAASLRASDARIRLAWPGPDPTLGAEVSFRQGADAERVIKSGLWGFFRLLDQTRIRHRENGQRHLVDLKTQGGRIFFEIVFDAPLNPVSARQIAKGLSCPPVL